MPGVSSIEPSNVIIVGAGGFGREVLQYVREAFTNAPQVTVKGFLDDDPASLNGFELPYSVLGDTTSYKPQTDDRFVIAVGDPQTRAALAQRLAARGAAFLSLVHPKAYVSGTASLGVGCIVAPFATIGAHATLGDHSVLTFYASVGHDAVVGCCCALSPHAVTNGGSRIGDRVFIGSHAVINPLQSVADDAKIAAGAVVYRPVPAHSLAAGNPAKSRPLW